MSVFGLHVAGKPTIYIFKCISQPGGIMKKSLSVLICVGLLLLCNVVLYAQSPGDIVGYTQQLNQTIGSTGQRIVVDNVGGIHFAWTNAHPYPGTRHVYYNYINNSGPAFGTTGTQVSYRNRDGYCQIAATSSDLPIIAYHNAATTGAESLFCAIDAAPGLGAFNYYHPRNMDGSSIFIWPYITTDRTGRIHLVATQQTMEFSDMATIEYTRSNSGGTTWVALARVDTATTISAIIVASPVSDKVAIIYTHPTDTTAQNKNNVYYIQSSDGLLWDFRHAKINITNYGQNNDSLFAFNDVDAAYDYNDNLHIIWNAQYVDNSGRGSDRVFLYHYDRLSQSIVEISHVDVPHISRCGFGAVNLAINKMSIAAERIQDLLITVYTRFDTLDCSSDGLANGEIYMQYSRDNGINWSIPRDITNSHTPGCIAGDCASDIWPSMAEHVDSSMHISYFCFNGGPDFWNETLASPLLYLQIPVRNIGISDPEPMPELFTLGQNYPNPFNAQTTISFNLEQESVVNLSVYDIKGSKVATLADGIMYAGSHDVIWDASDISSGVYYYKLSIGEKASTKKMVLLK